MIKSESVDNYFSNISNTVNKLKTNIDNYNRVNSNTHVRSDHFGEINNFDSLNKKNNGSSNIKKQKIVFTKILKKRNFIGPIELIEQKV